MTKNLTNHLRMILYFPLPFYKVNKDAKGQ